MTHVFYLGDGSSSVIAFVLIASVSAITLVLLPRSDKASQLFWIGPCLALSLFEVVTDNFLLSPARESAAGFLAIFTLSVALSRRAQSSLGRSGSNAASLAICAILSLGGALGPLLGLSQTAAAVLMTACVIAACCWPMATPRIVACMREHPERVVLFTLLLVYGLAILEPGVDGAEPASTPHQFEAALPFVGVMIGFVASTFALRHAFRDKERLIAAEQAARSALEDTTQLLRALIETTPAAVFVKGLDGRYRLINKLAAEWCDRTKPEVLGRTDFDLFPPDLAQAMREHDDLVITTGQQHKKDFQLRSGHGGARRAVTTCKFPLFGADGKVKLVAGLAIDMTATKRHELDLEEARFKAEEANCAKSNFLAHMSHELRTPLNAIMGFSEIIHSGALGPIGNDLYRQYAIDIHTAGQLLLAHVDDLLDMSQIDSDTLDLSLQSLNLGLMVADCCHLMRGQAERKQVRIEIDRARPLPQVFADLRATMQVLVSLVGNAVKYLPAGSTITIAGGRTESGVPYLLIEDDGPGLNAKSLQSLVDPWNHRPATMADDGRGGLGLLLPRKMMEAQGGRLVVESAPGKGTRIACQFANRSEDIPATRSVGV